MSKNQNKVREMRGVKPGRGSAGRASGGTTGVKQKHAYMGLAEFRRHCDRFMVEHVPGWQCKDFSGRDVTEEIRQMAW